MDSKHTLQVLAAPEYMLCKQYGFNETMIKKRVKQMGLTEAELPLAGPLIQHAILPFHNQIMDDFYQYVFNDPEMRPFIGSEQNIDRLKKTQTEYLLSFGINFQSAGYFEYRLRVGVAHARISMPMHIYIAAYNKMQCLLLNALEASEIDDPEIKHQYRQLIIKLIYLDISLAIDAYNFMTMISLSESVNKLEKEKSILSNQLMHDTLTGVLSRAYILDVLTKYIAVQQRSKYQQLSVALLDIDHFKNINDSYGHQIGDEVLKKFCETVNAVIRGHDYLGRYGGEEFLFIIVNTDPDNALRLVERVRATIATSVYDISGQKIQLTTSIGLTHITDGDDVNSMIERADSALYKAKAGGRNQTVLV